MSFSDPSLAAAWPAICTAFALLVLLVLIIRYQVHAFAALLAVSIGLGLAAGMPPIQVLASANEGVGRIMADLVVILGLGAMLGRMLEASGAAEVIARTLVNAFGPKRASLAILLAAYIIGIPVFFGVGFLMLIPVVYRVQRETGQSLLYYSLPLGFSLATMHSLTPPHPGIVIAVGDFKADMVQTMLFGALMGIPIVLAGWLGPGRWWAKRHFVAPPEHLAGPSPPIATGGLERAPPAPSFALSLTIVLLPLILSFVGFGVKLLAAERSLPGWMLEPVCEPGKAGPYSTAAWLQFLGHPTMALFVPTGLAFLLLGVRRGMGRDRLAKVAGDGLLDVGSIALLIGAAGAFSQIIKDSKAGDYIRDLFLGAPLTPVLIAYCVSALLRAALGSATAAIIAASAVLAKMAHSLPGQETLLVLAVANGVTFMTQPGDSGFWMVKEYMNLSVKDVFIRYNVCRMTMSLVGLVILLAVEAWW